MELISLLKAIKCVLCSPKCAPSFIISILIYKCYKKCMKMKYNTCTYLADEIRLILIIINNCVISFVIHELMQLIQYLRHPNISLVSYSTWLCCNWWYYGLGIIILISFHTTHNYLNYNEAIVVYLVLVKYIVQCIDIISSESPWNYNFYSNCLSSNCKNYKSFIIVGCSWFSSIIYLLDWNDPIQKYPIPTWIGVIVGLLVSYCCDLYNNYNYNT